MPYFYVNADKKPYRLSSIEKHDNKFGTYIIYARRWEEHWKNTIGGRRLEGRERHYSFVVPTVKKKFDIKFDNAVYSCKQADKITLAKLVNHLSTLFDLEQL